MNRRKALATAGAVSLTASAAVIVLGSSMGLFGLTDDGGSRIGKLSPVDAISSTSTSTPTVPAPAATVPVTPGATTPTTTDTRPDDHGVEPGDDRGGPEVEPNDDRGQVVEPGDDHGGDNRGPGSSDSGGDNSGPGSSSSGSGSGHDDD